MPAAPFTRRKRSPLRPLVRGVAVAGLAGALTLPLLRRRLRLRPVVTTAAVAVGPLALAVLRPRTNGRDAAIFALQMWAFTAVHELPYDDPERCRERLRINYPIALDRLLGAGTLPNTRLQRALSRPDRATRLDRVLAWIHWAWFLEPYAALLYILVRDNRNFARAARQMSVAYDLGCAVYCAVPTAPPWWAAENGYTGPDEVRRVMVEVGEESWGRAWPHLYDSLGGNPWAAMPSLHFATSLLAGILLAESSPVAGGVALAYAGVLGFALVYLGEHYVADLLAGLALVGLVRGGEPLAEPLALALSDGVQRLERLAAG